MKLLLIEDERKIAEFARKGLEASGFVVDVAHDGTDGLNLATTRPYDALILDIMLPGRDGLSILRTLRDRRIAVPVLLVTARGELNERVEGLNLGADDYLTKPFYIDELIARIHGAGTLRAEIGTPGAMTGSHCAGQRLAMRIGAGKTAEVTALAEADAGNEEAHFRRRRVGVRLCGEGLRADCQGGDHSFSDMHVISPQMDGCRSIIARPAALRKRNLTKTERMV